MDRLVTLLRRSLLRRNAGIDPFTIMEIATLLRPAIAGRGDVESAVQALASALERAYVDDARRVAVEVVEEVVRACRSSGCE